MRPLFSLTKILRKYHRYIAAFLLINFISSLVVPTVSWALTSGPATPEAFSFEPVDTTDMVNLQTGDFVYNIPLLEVPGPGGGYPLSLSYHGGIQTDAEASWVGLGWTLNPGSISRYVSGTPDDYNEVQTTVRDFWEGGKTSQFGLGLSFGAGQFSGPSVGISVSNDSYRGVNSQVSFSDGLIGVSLGSNGSSFNFRHRGASFSSNGGFIFGQGVGFGSSISFSGNSDSRAFNLNAGFKGVGVSLAFDEQGSFSSINSTNFSQHNQSQGSISTTGFSLNTPPIPIPGTGVSLQLSMSKRRYWSDETDAVYNYGSLFNRKSGDYDTIANDTYSVSDYDEATDFRRKDKLDNFGAFLNYDIYNVSGQGISGTMQPTYFKSYVNFRNKKRESDSVWYDEKTYDLNDNSFNANVDNRPTFRFLGEFANSLIQGDHSLNPSILIPGVIAPDPQDPFKFSFSGFEQDSTMNGYTSAFIENGTGQKYLPGGKVVRYVLNRDFDSNSGFLETASTGFIRDDNEQIGGFKVTNTNGMTYHYSLPVYAYNEETYTENIDKSKRAEGSNITGGLTFNHLRKPEKYAYTWLLTAITGPDFVDRGGTSNAANGILDEEDWGYWVEFDYGLWTKDYNWRTPSEGFQEDLDNNFQSFSMGTKEIYYLDAISTKTHSALFIKSLRKDGKGVVRGVGNDAAVKAFPNNGNAEVDLGGFIPKFISNEECEIGLGCLTEEFYRFPIPLLKLERIVLVKNDSDLGLEITKTAQFTEFPSNGLHRYNPNGGRGVDIRLPTGRDLLDTNDFVDVDTTETIRAMEFITDYSLSPHTPNSFENDFYIDDTPPIDEASYTLGGKLTLRKLQMLGKRGQQVVPPSTFHYDVAETVFSTDLTFSDNISTLSTLGDFQHGDILQISSASREGFFLLEISDDFPLGHGLRQLGSLFEGVDGSSYGVDVRRTKNPPYSSDHRDLWGFYKSDYFNQILKYNNFDHLVSETSARNVDVWSLRKVTTPIGSSLEMDYESDTYNPSESYHQSHPLMLNGLSLSGNQIIGRIRPLHDFFRLETVDTLSLKLSYEFDNNFDLDLLSSEELGQLETRHFRQATTLPSIKGRFVNIGSQSEPLVTIQLFETPSLPDWAKLTQANIAFSSQKDKFGGGIRVKAIANYDLVFDSRNRTLYSYDKAETNNNQLQRLTRTSGVTSYEPIVVDPIYRSLSDGERTRLAQSFVDDGFKEILRYSRFIPGPGVNYKNVLVSNDVIVGNDTTLVPGISLFKFQVFDRNMIEIPDAEILNSSTSSSLADGTTYNSYSFKRLKLKDYTSSIGSLLENWRFDNLSKAISVVKNEYLFTGNDGNPVIPGGTAYENNLALYGAQGVFEESFVTAQVKRNEQFNINTNTPNQIDLTDPSGRSRLEYYIKDRDQSPGGLSFFQGIGRAIQSFISLFGGGAANSAPPPPELVITNELYGAEATIARYPSILTGSKSINFRSGKEAYVKNLEYDPYSGALTKSYFDDGYGNKYVTELTPAYELRSSLGKAYTTMGVTTGTDSSFKNMLAQEGASFTFKMADAYLPLAGTDYSNDIESLVGASLQSWQDQAVAIIPGGDSTLGNEQANIFRKQSVFAFIGDGTVPYEDGTFPIDSRSGLVSSIRLTGNEPSLAYGWQKQSEVSKYDIYSHALETIDINGNRTATKMDINQEHVMATAVNAGYSEFAHVTFENYFDPLTYDFGGNVFPHAADIGTDTISGGHTGNYGWELGASQYGINFTIPAPPPKTYQISVWSTSPNIDIVYWEGAINFGNERTATKSPTKSTNGWYLVRGTVSASGTADISFGVKSQESLTIDDFRVHPVNAGMVSYVYNDYGELTHVLDNNNMYTEYSYDGMGRLTTVKRETFDHGSTVLSTHETHFSKLPKDGSISNGGGQ